MEIYYVTTDKSHKIANNGGPWSPKSVIGMEPRTDWSIFFSWQEFLLCTYIFLHLQSGHNEVSIFLNVEHGHFNLSIFHWFPNFLWPITLTFPLQKMSIFPQFLSIFFLLLHLQEYNYWSMMAKWLVQVSQWHEIYCHCLKVMSSHPNRGKICGA